MRTNTLFGLPPMSLNILSGAAGIILVCLGFRIARAPELALKVANTQLVTGSSAKRLEQLADRLERQAKIIKQKDEAYEQLQNTYEEYLYNRKGDVELGKAIEAIDDIPVVDDVDVIKREISQTEDALNQITNE